MRFIFRQFVVPNFDLAILFPSTHSLISKWCSEQNAFVSKNQKRRKEEEEKWVKSEIFSCGKRRTIVCDFGSCNDAKWDKGVGTVRLYTPYSSQVDGDEEGAVDWSEGTLSHFLSYIPAPMNVTCKYECSLRQNFIDYLMR